MKELDPETTRALRWIENIRKDCRLRHVVVWIGGNVERAARWESESGIRVAVIPADSIDVKVWKVDPKSLCSVIFVENHMAIGGLADVGVGSEADFRLRVKALADRAIDMKHGDARMWGRRVARNLVMLTP